MKILLSETQSYLQKHLYWCEIFLNGIHISSVLITYSTGLRVFLSITVFIILRVSVFARDISINVTQCGLDCSTSPRQCDTQYVQATKTRTVILESGTFDKLHTIIMSSIIHFIWRGIDSYMKILIRLQATRQCRERFQRTVFIGLCVD